MKNVAITHYYGVLCFKNYFVIVFSSINFLVFSFQQYKQFPNILYILYYPLKRTVTCSGKHFFPSGNPFSLLCILFHVGEQVGTRYKFKSRWGIVRQFAISPLPLSLFISLYFQCYSTQ